MFTDMVGFTGLAQSDEAQSLLVLERHGKLLRPFFSRFGGREVKTIGDSFLVEFDSALDAVNCAVGIQKFLHDYNLSSHESWKISLRIGVHLGDVVHQYNDIFGDAVNVASRLQPLAEPEGVCISEQVYDHVRNKIAQPLEKLVSPELKNVRFSIDVYKVVMPWERKQAASHEGTSETHRIAVLPFVNMSPDPNDEYFADGLTEELISKLSLAKDLRIIARTSIMKYKNETKGISEIGEELGVSYLVEGSVRKAVNKIRVTAQLIQTNTEEHLWASSYDKTMDDIFAVQTDIAEKISKSLHSGFLSSNIEKGETKNVVAYSYYLQGKQLLNERGSVAVRQALELFYKAATLDPSFVRAYVSSAYCYAFLGMRSELSFDEAVAPMKSSAAKALAIDHNLAEVHALLSFIAWIEDDHSIAEQEALKAIELNPSLSEAYIRLSYVKATRGYLKESIAILERAQQLDPLSSDVVGNLGLAYFWAGREADALELWNRNRALLPRLVADEMAEYYLEKKDLDNAEEQVKFLESSGEDHYNSILKRAELHALKGEREAAEQAIAKLEKDFKGAAVTDRNVGFVRYYLGDADAFFEAMFRALGSHVLDPFRLRYSLLLDNARHDSRYTEILIKNGIYSKDIDPPLNRASSTDIDS